MEKKFKQFFFMLLADLWVHGLIIIVTTPLDNTHHNGTPYDQPATTLRKLGCVDNHVEKIIESENQNNR